jgi:hypothetical protein
MIYTVMERPMPIDIAGVAQLRFFGNFSYWCIVNVHKILPPPGVIAVVDLCCLSVSTIADKGPTKP